MLSRSRSMCCYASASMSARTNATSRVPGRERTRAEVTARARVQEEKPVEVRGRGREELMAKEEHDG